MNHFSKSFRDWLNKEVELLAFLDKEIPSLSFLDKEV